MDDLQPGSRISPTCSHLKSRTFAFLNSFELLELLLIRGPCMKPATKHEPGLAS
jgi:hypothetical protein